MCTTISQTTHLTFLDFEVPDFEEDDLFKIKGANMVPERLVLDLGEAPECGSIPLPEKQEVEEPVVVVIKTKIYTKQTKKKGLF